MKLLVATRSESKAREIRDLFAGLPFALVFPFDLLLQRLPDEAALENGSSYIENAVAKARYFSARAGLATVADDSGFPVGAYYAIRDAGQTTLTSGNFCDHVDDLAVPAEASFVRMYVDEATGAFPETAGFGGDCLAEYGSLGVGTTGSITLTYEY